MDSKRLITLSWLAMLSTMGVLVTGMMAKIGPTLWLRYAGVGLLMTSALWFIPPFFVLSKFGEVEVGINYMDTAALVALGPYALVRHPQYVGYMLLNAGFMMLTQSWGALVLGLCGIGFLVALGVEEERLLTKQFREAYIEYCQRVPRFNFVAGIFRYLKTRMK